MTRKEHDFVNALEHWEWHWMVLRGLRETWRESWEGVRKEYEWKIDEMMRDEEGSRRENGRKKDEDESEKKIWGSRRIIIWNRMKRERERRGKNDEEKERRWEGISQNRKKRRNETELVKRQDLWEKRWFNEWKMRNGKRWNIWKEDEKIVWKRCHWLRFTKEGATYPLVRWPLIMDMACDRQKWVEWREMKHVSYCGAMFWLMGEDTQGRGGHIEQLRKCKWQAFKHLLSTQLITVLAELEVEKVIIEKFF